VRALWQDPRCRVVALAMGGYLAVSWCVRDFFPFSTFSMYAAREASASRLVARDARGRIAEIDRFTSWRCEGPLDVRAEACTGEPRFATLAYKDREAADYIVSHGGDDPSAAPVDVVRRIWWASAEGGPPPAHDCLLQRCTAVPR
jgi:hypothetical protein